MCRVKGSGPGINNTVCIAGLHLLRGTNSQTVDFGPIDGRLCGEQRSGCSESRERDWRRWRPKLARGCEQWRSWGRRRSACFIPVAVSQGVCLVRLAAGQPSLRMVLTTVEKAARVPIQGVQSCLYARRSRSCVSSQPVALPSRT